MRPLTLGYLGLTRPGGGGGGAPATAYHPTLLAQPSATGGTVTQGDTISATGDTWANDPLTLTKTYQWYRGRTLIAGAESATYAVQAADVGHKLRCFVTGTNAKGAWTGYTAFTERVVTSTAATHKVAFGAKTRSGHGGYALGSAITVTGGASSADWTVNAANELVPSGTYGNAKTFALSSYSLTMSDASTVHITMVANRFSVAVNSADTTSSFQLRNILLLSTGVAATEVVLGDEIHCRSGTLNAAAGDYRVRMRATPHTGSGTIAIFDLACPRLSIDSAVSGDVLFPYDFWNCSFYDNVSGAATTPILSFSNTGYGVNAYDCAFEFGAAITTPQSRDGFRSRGTFQARRCTFRNMNKGITNTRGSEVAPPANVDDNIFREMFEDCYSGQTEGATGSFDRNFSYDKKFVSGGHGDGFQHLGFTDGANHAFGSCKFNIMVRNVGTDTMSDYQAFFFDDSTGASRLTGAAIENNIALITSGHGIWLTRFTDPSVQRNTTLFDFQANSGVALDTGIKVDTGKEGSGGTFALNLANLDPAVTASSQTGASFTGNKTVARVLATYQAALPAYAATGLTSRALVLAAMTPLAGGTARNVDGTYAGALLPNGCWNMGEVY